MAATDQSLIRDARSIAEVCRETGKPMFGADVWLDKLADALEAATAIPAAAPAPAEDSEMFLAQLLADAGGELNIDDVDAGIGRGTYRVVLYRAENPLGYRARLEGHDGNLPESIRHPDGT